MDILHYPIATLAKEGELALAKRLACLDEQEIERYEHSGQAGLQFLLARSQLKRELAKRCGIEPQEIRFSYNEQGKPSCQQAAAQGVHFNISHSKQHLLIALSEQPVGVDIEEQRERKPEQLAALAKRFMPEEQCAQFIQRGCPQQEFYDCWCASEAIIKLWGRSIWHAKHIPAYLYREGQLSFTQSEEERGFSLRLFTPCENYSAAVASQVFRLPAPSI